MIFIVGALFDRVVLTRVVGRAIPGQSILVAMIIGTVGLSYVLKGAVRVIPYTEEVRRLPPFSSGAPIFIGPVVLQHQDIAIVIAAIAIMAALWAFFSFTLDRQGAARHQPEPARRGAGRNSGARDEHDRVGACRRARRRRRHICWRRSC